MCRKSRQPSCFHIWSGDQPDSSVSCTYHNSHGALPFPNTLHAIDWAVAAQLAALGARLSLKIRSNVWGYVQFSWQSTLGWCLVSWFINLLPILSGSRLVMLPHGNSSSCRCLNDCSTCSPSNLSDLFCREKTGGKLARVLRGSLCNLDGLP